MTLTFALGSRTGLQEPGWVVLVVVVPIVVVLVVVDPTAQLDGSVGAESSKSRQPSRSRLMPMRVPEPKGTAVYVRSWPTVAAWARSWASVNVGSLTRSLLKVPFDCRSQPRSTPPRL